MKRLLASAFLGATMLMGGCSILETNKAADSDAAASDTRSDSEKEQDELATYAHAFAVAVKMVRNKAANKITYEQLLVSAYEGMLSDIDPHSEYLNPEELEKTLASITGTYGGIGISYEVKGDDLVVQDVTKDLPADKAGIATGDRITRINGETAAKAALLLKGEPDTVVKIEVVKAGEKDKAETLELKRVEIVAQTVSHKLLKDGVAHIRISYFNEHTGKQVEAAIKELRADPANDIRAVILDLRGNLGGSVIGAVDTADAFLEKGLITYTRGQDKDIDRWEAEEGDVTGGKPLVVLVDAHSASASEIVTGALQDHKRATVMGKQTYGKGLVQSTLKFSNYGLKTRKDGVKLTTAYYYTPLGRSIQIKGITPDIYVADFEGAAAKKKREADFARAPANPDKDKAIPDPVEKCEVTATGRKIADIHKSFLSVTDSKPDAPLLCAYEYLSVKTTFTMRKPFAAKP